MSNDEFLTDGYQRHNQARQNHLASLSLDLWRKTVLELGAGIGDHTEFWLNRHCQVTSVEGRNENAIRLRRRFPDPSQVVIVEWDLENPTWQFGSYQIVYAYGILYHLRNPLDTLRICAKSCTELLLVETVVSRDSKPTHKIESEDNPTACLHGTCTWPTRESIADVLLSSIEHVYTPLKPPKHDEFPQDWSILPADGLVRAVFIGSREPLVLNTLQEYK